MADVTKRIPEDQYQPWRLLGGVKRGALVSVDDVECHVTDLAYSREGGTWWVDLVTRAGALRTSVRLDAVTLIDADPPLHPEDPWPTA